ncbi:putative ribosomal protein L11 [Cardiosporidium cionae]|uniref:Ribosomal protein L11 n=1 Tax=Cardiosporidium cionae TaxID=476202 RepID=A0ABQ7J4X6_9APIC|nr:putative ribosomal protein L11 [Cardiosporidium cionae]|eukprot:KAF8818764.1 putative ribosomal protein L11 [Cardiosporidium cionae]
MSSTLGTYRLLVGAATAKPSPAIGQTLGPLGINMMLFCKEFNARTSSVRPEVPIQVALTAFNDRSFRFWMKTPSTFWFLKRTARIPNGSSKAKHEIVGNITLKEVYHIAITKSMDPPLIGLPLETLCKQIISTANACGIAVTKELLPEFKNRDYRGLKELEILRKEIRQRNKAARRGKI